MFTETRTLNLQRTPSLRLFSNCDLAAQQQAAGVQFEDFVWGEAVITGALPEVSLLVLPSDGWRVLPADLQVYPSICKSTRRFGGQAGGWLIHCPRLCFWFNCRSQLILIILFCSTRQSSPRAAIDWWTCHQSSPRPMNGRPTQDRISCCKRSVQVVTITHPCCSCSYSVKYPVMVIYSWLLTVSDVLA